MTPEKINHLINSAWKDTQEYINNIDTKNLLPRDAACRAIGYYEAHIVKAMRELSENE